MLLIQNSDFISIHDQGGERYKDCIKLDDFDKMKKTAFLINTSRGEVVDEESLYKILKEEQIFGSFCNFFYSSVGSP